jgi:hypothetical protein
MHNFSFLGNTSSPVFWALWSVALIWQNYAFTRVSRARNSGSLRAHAIASLQSNGVWFLQSLFVYSAFMNILTGKAGILKALAAALYYTVFTMMGSIYAHYVSLRKEKGASAVGANRKYAQIDAEDWKRFRTLMGERALVVDTGDGVGTFTPAELAKLKELCGTVLETVDEIVTESLPACFDPRSLPLAPVKAAN